MDITTLPTDDDGTSRIKRLAEAQLLLIAIDAHESRAVALGARVKGYTSLNGLGQAIAAIGRGQALTVPTGAWP